MVARIDQSNQILEKYIRSLGISLSYVIDQNEELIVKTTNLEKHFKVELN